MCTAGNVVEAAGVVAGVAVTVGTGGAGAGAGLAIAAGGFAAGSALDSAHAQADAQERQAKIDDLNAKLAGEQADLAVQDAEVKAGQIASVASRTQAQQKAAAASGNIDVSSGAPAQAMSDTAVVAEHLKSMARLEGARAAYGYKSQGTQFAMMAANKRATASDITAAGYLSAFGAGISGAARVYGMGKQLNWWEGGGPTSYAGPSHTSFNDQGL